MESMELSHAEKIIGVGKDYDMKHALKCFEVAHWAKVENREFNLLSNVLGAKNSLMRHLITEQKKRFRFFEIESPFDNTCSKCHGSGELYKFFKKSVKVNCHICGGSAKLEDNCPICKGSGRYIRRWKQGGGVNLECKRCQGKGKVKVSCRECKGKGQLKKAVLSDELKSTTPCKNCRQLGFIVKDSQKSKKQKQKHFRKDPRQIFQPFPVKSRDGKTLADLIKQG